MWLRKKETPSICVYCMCLRVYERACGCVSSCVNLIGAVIVDGSDGGERFSKGDYPGVTGTYVCRKDILFYGCCPYGCGYTKLNTAFKESTCSCWGEKRNDALFL
jgi:hypothetical protein